MVANLKRNLMRILTRKAGHLELAWEMLELAKSIWVKRI